MTLYTLAQRYIGIREIAGVASHPLIVWWLSLCSLKDSADSVPWCSAFLNGMAWELRLPRSKSAAARSWLEVGTPIDIFAAEVGFDVVVLKRGPEPQPGPEVTRGAPGHVGLFAGLQMPAGNNLNDAAVPRVLLLAGNQGDEVSISSFPLSAVLGVRRLSA